MAVVLVVVGALIILIGLLDMYRSLLRPSGSGPLTRALIRSLWAAPILALILHLTTCPNRKVWDSHKVALAEEMAVSQIPTHIAAS